MWKMHRERLLGAFVLTLIFFASATVTWSFFSDTLKPTRAAQTATIVAPLQSATPDAFASVSLSAKSAIVLDITEHKTLYALNPDVQLPLASLTKIPLVLVVAQVLPQDAIITMPGGISQFAAGTRWKLSDIINFTLAISSNDGADVLAAAAQEGIRAHYPDAPVHDATLWRMNRLAGELGLSHTYFLNDNGLDESPTQSGAYGTARDIAAIFAYAASTSPQTFSATTKQGFSIRSIDGARATAINTDAALPAIPGIIMGKTGYTDLAGGNLAVVYEQSGHRIVAVVLGSTQAGRFDDMKTLIVRTDQSVAAER